jgi:hypothetical protein
MYGTFIAFTIGIGSLAATHRSVIEYAERTAQSTRLSGAPLVGAAHDHLVVRSAGWGDVIDP